MIVWIPPVSMNSRDFQVRTRLWEFEQPLFRVSAIDEPGRDLDRQAPKHEMRSSEHMEVVIYRGGSGFAQVQAKAWQILTKGIYQRLVRVFIEISYEYLEIFQSWKQVH